MSTQPATLTLTTDELLAILQVMGASTLDGLGDPLAGLSERDQAARLNAGAETLLNRGLCRIDGDQLVMDDMMVAFVGACVIPDATLLIAATGPGRERTTHYFHATPYIAVEHQSPRPGVHLFTHLPQATDLLHRVEALLALVAVDQSRRAGADAGAIPDAQLNTVLQAINRGDGEAARATLVRLGWSGQALDALVSDLASAPSWVAMAGWGLREPEPAGSTSAILYAGDERYWLFTPMAGNPEQLTVSSPDGPRAVAAFSALAAPLCAVIPSTTG